MCKLEMKYIVINLFGLLDNKNEIFENKFFVENNILNAKLIVLHYL